MKSKNVSTPSLALKVNEIKTLMDRKFMSANKLKKLHDIVKTAIEAISEYFDILEDQRVRSHKDSQKDVRKGETSLDEFVITNVKMRVSMSQKDVRKGETSLDEFVITKVKMRVSSQKDVRKGETSLDEFVITKVKMRVSSQKDVRKGETSLDEFVITKVKMRVSSQKDVRKGETSLDEFVITKVKMRVSMSVLMNLSLLKLR